MDEYDSPEVYEAEYGRWQGDFTLFCNAFPFVGRVLDLACGTGRLTTALAEHGHACVGLDVSNDMLSYAMQKSSGSNIKYLTGDMRDFDLQERFDLITLGGNSFQCLLTLEDQQRCLARVVDHLVDGGVFIFNTRNTLASELCTYEAWECWHEFVDLQGNPVSVYGKQWYNVSDNLVTYTTRRVWEDCETETKTTLKFTSKQTLEELLKRSGLVVAEVYGDYDGSPWLSTSPQIIVNCIKTKG